MVSSLRFARNLGWSPVQKTGTGCRIRPLMLGTREQEEI